MKGVISNYRKYWNCVTDYYEGNKIPRKTKKFIKNRIKDKWLPTKEEDRWNSLPECKWCDGCGSVRDHPYDTGYGCPDCYGTGKQGWKFDKDRNKIETSSGLRVVEW